ncbi:iron complex transport system permease protein [Methylobacterium sp. UNC300MFChir4.1]|uniref:FecCD family ABC transporter permease n=1 Tax=Methylobacterium sp. UNC300MFChir4.1 TaxID=1502747 RepID=UPI0008C64442|nr:iron ABC transporter permease [Methylobacterium sp. UNC300MFChir4.1]SEP30458.1 iron complex transport system permease protein [Methylobacterium sp. UNC300MFChir4.1]
MRLALRLLPLLVLALAFGMSAGHDWAGPADLLHAFAGGDDLRSRLLREWRLPRVLASACVGAMLGLGGAIFQGVFRNPLAEPYLLGSAGGAAIGATIALLVPLGIPSAPALAGLSFAGAWGATVLVLSVARGAATADAAGLLLAGVAVAAMLGAVRSFLMLALSDESVSLQVVLSWTLGGIQTPTWPSLALMVALSAGALALSLPLAGGLDLLGLGEEQARAFGLDAQRFLHRAVLVGAAVVALAVAYGGLVAFIGLVAPHVARWMVGPRHRRLLAVSAVVGAIVVTLGDGLARSLLPPAEIPLGLITAAAGGPFFLILLRRRMRL